MDKCKRKNNLILIFTIMIVLAFAAIISTSEAFGATKGDDGCTVITTTYDYDGVEFRLEVEVNAVQTHNAEGAIWSSWGRKVKISSDNRLSLVDN